MGRLIIQRCSILKQTIWHSNHSPGIYRWSIILADTDFFQQSVSVSAADFRGRNNRPSAKYFFIKLSVKLYLMHNIHMNFSSVISGVWWTLAEFWMNFGILCAHFSTVTQCLVEPKVPKCAHKIPTFIKNSTKVHQTPLITNEKVI
jgi:hypothetical protein